MPVHGSRRSTEAQPNEAGMVRILEATGRYQILRKLELCKVVAIARQGYPLRGVILDKETAGLDYAKTSTAYFSFPSPMSAPGS